MPTHSSAAATSLSASWSFAERGRTRSVANSSYFDQKSATSMVDLPSARTGTPHSVPDGTHPHLPRQHAGVRVLAAGVVTVHQPLDSAGQPVGGAVREWVVAEPVLGEGAEAGVVGNAAEGEDGADVGQ